MANSRTDLLYIVEHLTRLADECERVQCQLMNLVPDSATRGHHLYEAAHGLGGVPNSIRRTRGRVERAMREAAE